MSIFSKAITYVVGTSLVAGGFYGCGSASNNDQGTSFTATGFFQDVECEEGDAGRNSLLSSRTGTGVEGLYETTFMQLQNRLSTQFVRVDRFDCDYHVPGASIDIPSDSNGAGIVLEATGDGTSGDVTASQSCTEFFIVSPDIMSFLNVNQNSLPELPFRMIATCRAVGVTQSGDTLVTNDLNYTINFTEADCCLGSGSSSSSSSSSSSGLVESDDFVIE